VVRALYDAEVAYLDAQLGRLLTVLRDAVDLDNTLLIVTADHGENLGEGARWNHLFAVNDQLVRVPLLIRYPARFPAGLRIGGQCQTVDIVPTIYDVLGRTPQVAGLPGRSLVPQGFAAREVTFVESIPFYNDLARMSAVRGMERDISEFTRTLRAIRTDRLKYVWSSAGDHALYDLDRDPDEAVNIIAQQPDRAKDLAERLQVWWEAVPKYEAQANPASSEATAPLGPAERERLRALGYTH
jgi:arylsulfatase A-like enzyme